MIREQACAPANQPRELAKAVLAEYLVEPGDVLVVEPADAAGPIRLPADQPVHPDGRIDLGPYGRLLAAGKTVDQIEAEVQDLITQGQAEQNDVTASATSQSTSQSTSTKVYVRLVNPESKVVYVLGEVNAPGAYPLAGRETVLDALLAAGGLSDRANQHGLILARPQWPTAPPHVLPVCYRQIVQLGQTETNYQVLPGDRVFVPSMTLWDDVHDFFFSLVHWDRDRVCPRCRWSDEPMLSQVPEALAPHWPVSAPADPRDVRPVTAWSPHRDPTP